MTLVIIVLLCLPKMILNFAIREWIVLVWVVVLS